MFSYLQRWMLPVVECSIYRLSPLYLIALVDGKKRLKFHRSTLNPQCLQSGRHLAPAACRPCPPGRSLAGIADRTPGPRASGRGGRAALLRRPRTRGRRMVGHAGQSMAGRTPRNLRNTIPSGVVGPRRHARRRSQHRSAFRERVVARCRDLVSGASRAGARA